MGNWFPACTSRKRSATSTQSPLTKFARRDVNFDSISQLDSSTLPQFDPNKLSKFKQNYEEKGRFNLKAQVPFLSEIAEHYEKRFRSTNNWVDAVKAHALFTSCAVREGSINWKKKAFAMQLLYWNNNVKCSFDQQEKITSNLKKRLETVRSTVDDSLKDVAHALESDITIENLDRAGVLLCTKIPEIMLKSTSLMIEFTNELINHAILLHSHNIREVKSMLRDICVVGFGSVAREEATPYSDLEFMFLLSENASDNMALFERLAVTIYFLITNLGETRLKTFDIEELARQGKHGDDVGDWFMDEVTNGFKIDGLRRRAGHIPTGNTYEHTPNHYIATVDEMVRRYKSVYENPDMEKSKTGDLSTIFSSTTYLCGEERLYITFKEKLLQMTANERRHTATLNMIKQDISNFDLKVDHSLPKLKKVKKDIYRFPSLILFHLQILYDIPCMRPKDVIEALHKNERVSESLVNSLRVVYYAAQFARQATYSHFGSQCEDMTIQSISHKPLGGRSPWSIPRPLLSLMLMHLNLVKKQIKDGADDMMRLSEEGSTSLNEALAIINYYCGDYEGFLKMINGRNIKGRNTNELVFMFIYSLIKCGKHKRAKTELDKWSKNVCNVYLKVHLPSLYGDLYKAQDKYDKALEYHNKALDIRREVYGGTCHPNVASSYNRIGSVYREKGDNEKALEYYSKVLSIQLNIYSDIGHTEIAASYSNIGLINYINGYYEKALEHYNRTLSIQLKVYGDVNHKHIATSYSNIGLVYQKKGDFTKALESYKKVLSIDQSVYRDHTDPDCANSYNNVGLVYRNMHDYDKALESYDRALSIYIKFYGGRDHSHIAKSYSNIGLVYAYKGDYDKALEYYNKALSIYLNVYDDARHPDIEELHKDIATIEDCEKKIDILEQSLIYKTEG